MKAHENILVFYDKSPIYNPQMRQGEPYVRKDCGKNKLNKGNYGKVNESNTTISNGERYPLDVLYFQVVERTCHPTQKPIELLEYLIKTYTNEGDLVLDNTAGSGTTGVACKNLNRNYILIEQDENYCKIAEERIKNTTPSQTGIK
jgi:site-specific DNA-methyltransferase (adenine-specific)